MGRVCSIARDGVVFKGQDQTSVMGLIVSLYALNACSHASVSVPFRAFREFPNTAPYVGAFATHAEAPLVPQVPAIRKAVSTIIETLAGSDAPSDTAGDFSFVVCPLPKIALLYIFYEADDEFPASATCLYSNNADLFLPVEGLADLGEYTSRRILELSAP